MKGRKVSHTTRSGELEGWGHGLSPCLLLTPPENCTQKYRIVALIVCEETPFVATIWYSYRRHEGENLSGRCYSG